MTEYIYETQGEQVIGNLKGFILHKEEIVRCRDCANYEPNDYIHFTCEYLQCWAKPDDYCAWGERKERIEQ